MLIELRCPRCRCSFAAAPETPAEEVRARMREDGPWYALGPGDTFEDMLFAALAARGRILCPGCGSPVGVGEEGLSRLAREAADFSDPAGSPLTPEAPPAPPGEAPARASGADPHGPGTPPG